MAEQANFKRINFFKGFLTTEKDWNDVARNVRILNAHNYRGTICIEYEHGPVDGIEGSKQLMKDVLAAL